MKLTKITLIASAFAFAVTLAGNAHAFPDKEVTILINYGAGGAVDRTGRSVQKFLPDALGQSVLVENHGGAGGKIGIEKFMDKPRDGYTILTAFAPATTYVHFKNPDKFKLSDLAIINVQWIDPAIIVAQKSLGWTSLDDMVKAAKANPGKLTFGASGKSAVGAVLSLELFQALGLDVKSVPYKGGGKTRAAFKGGHVDMTGAGAGGATAIKDQSVVLGAFWNGPVAGWPDAKPINPMLEKYGVSVPVGGAYRFHAVHREVKDKHPDRFNALVEAFRKTTTENKEFIAFADKTNVGREWLGPEKSTALLEEVDAAFLKMFKASK